MPEFIYIVLIGLVLLAVMFAMITVDLRPTGFQPTGFLQSPTGFALASSGAPVKNRIILAIDNLELSAPAAKIAQFSGTVERSLTGKNSILQTFRAAEFDRGFLELRVNRTNNLGVLTISINGEEVYRGTPSPGVHGIEFDGELLSNFNTFEVSAGSTGFALLDKNYYTLDISIFGVDGAPRQITFGRENPASLILDPREADGRLKINLNGEEIFLGTLDGYKWITLDPWKLRDKNTVELVPQPGARFSFSLVELYRG